MDATGLTLLYASQDYPITPKDHGTAFLMENRHLWLRSQRQHAIIRVRHAVVKACRDYLDDSGFTLVDTPIFTPAACEGTSTLFGVPYFDEGTAYLTQSGQLYSEATAAAHGKVYCFGPTFRAEKSKTRRHLTEFWMVEPEIAFAHLEDAVDLAEGLVCRVVERVLETRKEELKTLERDTAKLENVKAPVPASALRRRDQADRGQGLEDRVGERLRRHRRDRDRRGLRQARGGAPLSRRPSRPSTWLPIPTGRELSLSADILAPEGYGEIVGGGERLADGDLLLKRIHEHKLPEEAFRWYLDLRKYGSFPHAGFGMGIERVVTWICGIEHLRETIAFPRMLYRIYP